MHATPLCLSHWDASIPISIPTNVVEALHNYHLMGVRFLYDCFRKMQKGAILNHEDGMNFPIQISAFFHALQSFITPQSPVLIVCLEESLNAWHYHLTNHGGFFVTVLSSTNSEEILDGELHRVILSTVDNAKLLKEIKESDFFAVVVDALDKVTTKAIIKQLKGQFNIGLTNRNFLKDPDQKLFWTMLKWSNPAVVGKFDEFCKEDTNHLENLRYPYGAWWQRLTWKFCDRFKKPSDEEQMQYKKELKKWSVQNRTINPKSEPVKRETRKRKLVEDTIKNETKEKALKLNIKLEETKNILVSKGTKPEILANSPKKVIDPLQELTNNQKSSQNDSQETINSDDTVIYDFKNSPSSDNNDHSILTSIMCSFDQTDGIKKEKLSFTNGQSQNFGSNSRKNDILSLLYGDDD